MSRLRRQRALSALALLPPLALAAAGGACLEAPGIEETWTRLELLASAPTAATPLALGDTLAVSADARITFRAIRTGELAIELRRGDAALAAAHPLRTDDDPAQHSRRVEALLAATTPVAGASRAVTGFDHLMMDLALDFRSQVPADLGAGEALWLLLFFGEGEEIRRAGMADTVLVTPVAMDSLEILTTGFALRIERGTP
ncbi:hypothetical protein FJ251_03930 [bacterium]|nr:hypothetical protein [bacterium]